MSGVDGPRPRHVLAVASDAGSVNVGLLRIVLSQTLPPAFIPWGKGHLDCQWGQIVRKLCSLLCPLFGRLELYLSGL